MKRFMKNIGLLIVLGIIVAIFSKNTYANGYTYEGDVFSNYPENENWTVEDVNIGTATLKVEKLNVNGLTLQFHGTVHFKDKDYTFRKNGNILKSIIGENTLYIDFNEKRNENGFLLVHTELIRNATLENLEKSKDLIGKDVVRLVFYDSITKDIIYFEEELQHLNGNALSRMLQLDKLDTNTIAGWRYKVLEPISLEVERIEPLEEETIRSFSALSTTSIDPNNSYRPIAQCDWSDNCYTEYVAGMKYANVWPHIHEEHYMRVRAYAHKVGTSINTGVNVVNKSVFHNNSWRNGDSNINLGRYTTPVATYLNTIPYLGNLDYISKVEWSTTNGKQRARSNADIGISLSYQFFSIGFNPLAILRELTPNLFKGKPYTSDNWENLYSSGHDYPLYSKIEFHNTYLDTIGAKYAVNYDLGTVQGTGLKRAEIVYYLPFFDTELGVLMGGSTSTRETFQLLYR